MPNYLFRCEKCGIEDEWILNYEESRKIIKCECGEILQRVFTPPFVNIPNPTSEARKGRGQG